jgi:hypothetical protein
MMAFRSESHEWRSLRPRNKSSYLTRSIVSVFPSVSIHRPFKDSLQIAHPFISHEVFSASTGAFINTLMPLYMRIMQCYALE